MTIQATVDAGTAGSTITNTVNNVALDQVDSNTTADDPSESITVGNETDLVVSKTVDDSDPDEGDTITFTVTLTNSGPARATNVSIDDALPAGLTAGTITPSQGSYTAPTWTIGTIDASSSATLTIQATVDAGTAGQTITNTVTNVTLDQTDSDTTTDDSSESVIVGDETDLVIAKTVDDATPDEGDTITFTVTVTNSGPARATNVSIDDALPAGLTAGTITPSQGSYTAPTWTVGTIDSGSNATLTIQATVDAGTAGQTITNTVTNVTLDQTDSNTTTDDLSEAVTVGDETDLVVGKTVDDATPDEGDTVTFTVTVTNSGPARATNVSIDDALPAGLTAGTITPSQGSYTAPTWTIGTIDSGSKRHFDHPGHRRCRNGRIRPSPTRSQTSPLIRPTATSPLMIPVSRSPSATPPIWSSQRPLTTPPRMRATPSPSPSRSPTAGRHRATNVSIDDALPAGLTTGTGDTQPGQLHRPHMDHRNHRQWFKRHVNDSGYRRCRYGRADHH